jgi:hypothetical protein
MEDHTLTTATTTATQHASLNLGFLTIVQDAGSYLGGYLVTNQWGRPLEFRLTTAVQPNRVQQILYARTLQSYICADLIGKTLVDKTGIPIQLVVTDSPTALDLRLRLDVPVAWVAHAARVDHPAAPVATQERPTTLPVRESIHCHARFPEDAVAINDILNQLIGTVDLAEPFQRIREAMGEARKMGVSK